MPKSRKTRVYTRQRGGVSRHYADFRDYADVGGRQEALIAPREHAATRDPDVAQKLATARLEELERVRRNRVLLGIERQSTIAAFARDHLIAKAKTGNVTRQWLEVSEEYLRRAVAFFGADRDLPSITTADVRSLVEWLGKQPNRRAGTLGASTVRHHVNCLSNLFRRAESEGYLPPGHNPVVSLLDKPVARREEARWLEVDEAALLLEAARTDAAAPPYAYPLLATFLLSGGRTSEVLGLEVEDASFDRETVTFRPNDWRRLKTGSSYRAVPLWPQLCSILGQYLTVRPPGRLLFPSFRTGREAMVTDFRKTLDRVAGRAGWKPGEIRSKQFRHTYCAARLQTLDNDAPVSHYTVAKELGHGGEAMVRRVYGHLGQVRHRSAVVEYRVEQHRERLAERLEALGL